MEDARMPAGASSLGAGQESRFAAQARQRANGYPTDRITAGPVDPTSASAERDALRVGLDHAFELRQVLNDELFALFQRIDGAGILTAPLDHILNPPQVASDERNRVSTPPDPPPNSGIGASYRQIRGRIDDLNSSVRDACAAIQRVKQAIDQ